MSDTLTKYRRYRKEDTVHLFVFFLYIAKLDDVAILDYKLKIQFLYNARLFWYVSQSECR